MPEYSLVRATTVQAKSKTASTRSVVMSEAAYEKLKHKLEAMTRIVEAAQDLRGIVMGTVDSNDEAFIQKLVALCTEVDLYDGLALLPERGEVILALIDIVKDLEHETSHPSTQTDNRTR